MSFNLLFICKPLVLNFSLHDAKIEFKYTNESQLKTCANPSDLNSYFKHLCILSTENNNSCNFNLYSNINSKSLFNFFIVNKGFLNKNKSNPKNIQNEISSDLYKILFSKNSTKTTDSNEQLPILLIGSIDGYIYWQTIDEKNKGINSINENILINTSFPIVYINSFRFEIARRSPLDDLFNKPKKIPNSSDKTNQTDNCLFAITKSGRIHLFAYTNEYTYKVCIIPHYIQSCIKFRQGVANDAKDYFVYSTRNAEVYAFKLEDCFKSVPLQPDLLKTEIEVKNFVIGKFKSF